MALTKVSPGVSSEAINSVGFKNKIIGGDFSTNPWQRGISFTSSSGAGEYTADRWQIIRSTEAIYNINKSANAPTPVQAGVFTQHCLELDITTTDTTIDVGQHVVIQQKIEGINIMSEGFGQAGERYITLSFWHNHTKTGTYCVSLCNAAANRSYVAEYIQDVSNTWERAVITIPVDQSGTWLYNTNIGVFVRFTIAAGTTFQTSANAWVFGNYLASSSQVNALDSTDNLFRIALVQLESGRKASKFENRSVGQELDLCQRYYLSQQSLYFRNTGSPATNVDIGHSIQFKSSMRAIPTITYNNIVYVNSSALSTINITNNSFSYSYNMSAATSATGVEFDYIAAAEL